MKENTNRNTGAACVLLCVVCSGVPMQQVRAEGSAQEYFEEIHDDPVSLRRFLYKFPKGGDLHNHLDGAVYAENLIRWAAEDGKCISLDSGALVAPPCNPDEGLEHAKDVQFNDDVVNKSIDALSTRNYERRMVSGHNQFFATFSRFFPATFGREGDMMAEVSVRSAKQNLYYQELMQSWAMGAAMALAAEHDGVHSEAAIRPLLSSKLFTQLVSDAIAQTNEIEKRRDELLKCGTKEAEPGCRVEIRYLAQVIRTMPKDMVFAQTILAFLLVQADERYVGLNFVAPEDHPMTLVHYEWQMSLIGELATLLPEVANGISLHSGELTLGLAPPEHLGWHINRAVHVAKAKRIGHGTDIVYDPNAEDLLEFMARNEILVEVNVTSAEVILGVSGRQHPYRLYQRFGVPVALSTDDEGVLRSDITNEYQKAVETLGIGYDELKSMSRNSLQYSFLPGDSIFADYRELQVVEHCREDYEENRSPGLQCRNFLEANDKALEQWSLETRFAEFEAEFE